MRLVNVYIYHMETYDILQVHSFMHLYTKVTKLFSYIKKIATVFAPTSTHIQIRVYLVR